VGRSRRKRGGRSAAPNTQQSSRALLSQLSSPRKAVTSFRPDRGTAQAITRDPRSPGSRARATASKASPPPHFTYLSLSLSLATVVLCEVSTACSSAITCHHLPSLAIIIIPVLATVYTTPFNHITYRHHVRQDRSTNSLKPAPIGHPAASSSPECALGISSRPGYRLAAERQCRARAGWRGRRIVVNGSDVRVPARDIS